MIYQSQQQIFLMTPNKIIDTMAEDAKKKNGRYRKGYNNQKP